MTGLDRNQTPKTRPVDHKRTALVASLDVGTSKIACMIARLKPSPPSDALRGRTHAVELIGYSQIQSRGVKAGAVVDLAECEQAVRQAVALAERMAKVRVESVLLSVSGGRLQGQLIEGIAENGVGGERAHPLPARRRLSDVDRPLAGPLPPVDVGHAGEPYVGPVAGRDVEHVLVQFGVAQDQVLILGILVAADDGATVDLAVERAVFLVADALAAVSVELVAAERRPASPEIRRSSAASRREFQSAARHGHSQTG